MNSAGSRRILFTFIALALPFLALGALEVLLRVTGVAQPEPLFVAAPEPGWRQPNEHVIQRFFADPAAAPPVSIDTAYFRARKAPGAFRAFVLGGSTAAGFPYGKWASLAGLLETRLRREHPGREIEVVPVAMSAVNSWTLADFTREVLAQAPDAILVYAGHNEYLGVLGVGSAFGGGAPEMTRLVLELQRLRLLSVGLRAITGLTRAAPRAAGEPATLMARIAAERRIPFGSPLYEAGIRQFEGNLDRMLSAYASRGIPVFLATLASNERDQPPFMPVPPEGTSDAAWQARFEAGLASLARDDQATAGEVAAALLAEAPNSGEGHYLRGRLLLANGDPEAARQSLLDAKDRDALRFRAPEDFNTLIREMAGRHGAHLVDVQGMLRAAARDGIIGDDLMLEHLHPNADGYHLLAEAFHAVLRQAGIPGRGRTLDAASARAESPLTEIDRLAGEYRVARLKADWPFHETRQPVQLPDPATEPERIARAWFDGQIDWATAMNRALAHYQRAGDTSEAARVAVNLANAFPFRADAAYLAGAMLLRHEDPVRALPFLDAAARSEPRNTRYLMSLAQCWYMSDGPVESLQVLERVLAVEPDHPTAASFIERLQSEQAQR